MSVRITDAQMVSDATRHFAYLVGDTWSVSWLPGQWLTYSQAVTAMTLAETVATQDLHCENPLWSHVDQWAAELGLSGPDAVVRASLSVEDAEPSPHQQSGVPEVAEDSRAATIRALRALVDWLETNPQAPVWEVRAFDVEPGDDATGEAKVRQLAEALGMEPVSNDHGIRLTRDFGAGVTWEFFHVWNEQMRRADAHNSYRDSVQSDATSARGGAQ